MNPTLVRPDMRYWRIDPDPRLRPGIVCYFVALPAVEARDSVFEAELLLPDGYSELVFSLNAQFERWFADEPHKRSTMCSSYVVGGRSRSVLTRNLGDLTIIGVKLDSGILRQLIATPLTELRDTTLSIAELNDQGLLDLEDALANARTAERIAELLNAFFLSRPHLLEARDRLVTELLHDIQLNQGALPILRWIRERGVDVRHFERRFCAWTGMTPKRYARVVRFRHGYYRLLRGESHRGAVGLHLEDFYDQSHFYRECKYFLGASPRARLERAMTRGLDISDHLLESELRSL